MTRKVRLAKLGRWRAVVWAVGVGAVLSGCAERPLRVVDRFCYRTLAEVDCHTAPLAGELNRRVGFYDEILPD